MPTREDQLTALLDDFGKVLANDPGALDSTDRRYVEHLHGPASEDVILQLKRACERVEGSARFYFTGLRGTGKSTELKRLARMLNASGSKAFIVDAIDYISDHHDIELVDLLLVTALAFADAIRAETGENLLREAVGTRFAAWLQTEVELKEFSAQGAKVVFREQQKSVIARVRQFNLERQERFIKECRTFISELADFARKQFRLERIVLVVDSLERLRGIGKAANEMFDRVVKVFEGGVDTLRFDRLQVIYAVPPYLAHLTNIKQFARVFTLASVRVCQPPQKARRQPRSEGLGAMREVVNRRFSRWNQVLTQDALDHLTFQSGGDLRQLLLRFLIDMLDEAYFALDRLPLAKDDPIIATVVDRHRVEFEGLVVRDEYPLLKTIAEVNSVELQNRDADLPAAARFFDIRAILSYRNGIDWVDLNPLLWRLIDHWTPPPPPTLPPNAVS